MKKGGVAKLITQDSTLLGGTCYPLRGNGRGMENIFAKLFSPQPPLSKNS